MPSLPSKLGISSSPTLTLAPSYVSLAELLPTPVYVSLSVPPPTSRLRRPLRTTSTPRLRLSHRTASASCLRLSHRTASAPSYISHTEPPPASPRSPSPPPPPPLPRLPHRTSSAPSYISLTEPLLPTLGRPHRTAPASTQLLSTTLPLDRSCPAPIPLVPSPPGPTHDLVRTPAFGSSGVSFHIPGSLSPSLKILGIIPKKQTYRQALQRIYLERGSVHACILLCTRGYTVVYTRVYSSLLGRRSSLDISSLGHGYFYLWRILLHNLALAL